MHRKHRHQESPSAVLAALRVPPDIELALTGCRTALLHSGDFSFHATAGHLRISSACRSPPSGHERWLCVLNCPFSIPTTVHADPPPGGSDWFRGSSTSPSHRKEKHTHLDVTPRNWRALGTPIYARELNDPEGAYDLSVGFKTVVMAVSCLTR